MNMREKSKKKQRNTSSLCVKCHQQFIAHYYSNWLDGVEASEGALPTFGYCKRAEQAERKGNWLGKSDTRSNLLDFMRLD